MGEPFQQRLHCGRYSFFIHEDGMPAFTVFEEQFVLKPIRLFAVGHDLPGQPKTISPIDELTELRSGFGRQFILVHRGAKPHAGEPTTTGKSNAHCCWILHAHIQPGNSLGTRLGKITGFHHEGHEEHEVFAAKPTIGTYFKTPTVCQASFTAFCCLLSVP